MLSRGVRVQLALFVVIALLGVGYLGIRYVGIDRWIGATGYTVKVDLAQGGGIFTNAEVTYRGVPVGRVGAMRLTVSGIQINLDITIDHKIPSDVQAVVADRSVIGEQYVDLQPRTTDGPYLKDGSVIAEQDTTLPPPVQDLLLGTDQLVHSVPIGALQTTIGELYNATQNISSSLQTLITSGSAFFKTAQDNLPQTIALIQDAKTVLATQNQQSDQIKQLAGNLKLIGDQLKSSDGDISKVLAGTAPAANEVTGLISDVNTSLGQLLNSLLTTSVVFLSQKDGVRAVLAQYPVAVSIGGLVTTPQGINVGLVPTFFDPMPCTSGYGGTAVRT
ncbi:MAG: MCE family protein, partial [Actinobacteria bacterium]|nr:MCE family protein [Actinomycetota bacterium]